MTPKELVERLNTVREGMEAGLDDWPIASQIWEYKEAATAIEQLTARVRELEAENAELHEQVDLQVPKTAFTQLKEQLAAEQLNNKLLREALESVIKVHGYKSGIPVEAISTQASTEALDKYVAEKAEEAYLNAQRAHAQFEAELTRQRDLAVDALENCRLLAARHRKEEWAGHIMRFCKDAGLSGSPIRNDAIKKSEAK